MHQFPMNERATLREWLYGWPGAIAAAVALMFGAQGSATAMSTDGYHTNMVLPVAVQTGSFSSDIYLSNPDSVSGVTVALTYYPANATTTGSPVACGTKTIAPAATNRYTLVGLCPGIAGSTNFGYLEAVEADASNHPFNIFTRVDNPLGQGFEVEGFPAHAFTAADAMVTQA